MYEKTTKNGTKFIVFKDGGRLQFKKSGSLARAYNDGMKVFYSPKGIRRVVCSQYALCCVVTYCKRLPQPPTGHSRATDQIKWRQRRNESKDKQGGLFSIYNTHSVALLLTVSICLNPQQVTPEPQIKSNSANIAMKTKSSDRAAAPKPVHPKDVFLQHIEHAQNNGNVVVSNKTSGDGTCKIIFADGGKLHLYTKKGIMIRKYADGKKVQYSPDGKIITVCSRHTLRDFYSACITHKHQVRFLYPHVHPVFGR